MHLYAKKYIPDIDNKEIKGIKKGIKKITKVDLNPIEVTFSIMYWRKANAIHKWFVDNCQNGEDDCCSREYHVNREQLKQLINIINRILGKSSNKKENIIAALNKKDVAEELLPTCKGFFFGDTDYDEYYWKDLKNTQEVLNDIFEHPEKYEGLDFYYSSSW